MTFRTKLNLFPFNGKMIINTSMRMIVRMYVSVFYIHSPFCGFFRIKGLFVLWVMAWHHQSKHYKHVRFCGWKGEGQVTNMFSVTKPIVSIIQTKQWNIHTPNNRSFKMNESRTCSMYIVGSQLQCMRFFPNHFLKMLFIHELWSVFYHYNV